MAGKQHLIISGLSVVVLIMCIIILVQGSKKEDYQYTEGTGKKLCGLQAGYIVDAPFIGGEKKREQAMNNCMKNFNEVMPSAYVTSTF